MPLDNPTVESHVTNDFHEKHFKPHIQKKTAERPIMRKKLEAEESEVHTNPYSLVSDRGLGTDMDSERVVFKKSEVINSNKYPERRVLDGYAVSSRTEGHSAAGSRFKVAPPPSGIKLSPIQGVDEVESVVDDIQVQKPNRVKDAIMMNMDYMADSQVFGDPDDTPQENQNLLDKAVTKVFFTSKLV